MHRTKKFLFSSALVVAFLPARMETANAFSVNWCNGQPVTWSFPTRMARDQCSMPDNSLARQSYDAAGWNWWQIANQMDWNWFYNDGCHITLGNGLNQTALVSRSSISALNGLTQCIYDNACFFSFDRRHLSECDVKLADDMSFSAEDESFWNWSNVQQGRVVNVHEFGHALGMNHTEGFDIMRASTPYPVAGGNTSEPYGDDANGARFLYLGGSTNLFASAQQLLGGAIQATGPSQTTSACRGSSISVTYTVGNNGSVGTSGLGFRIFLNNGPNATGGWNMWAGTATNPAGGQFTETRTLTVPNVPNGLYWILWQIDTNNDVSEFNEGDNAVHSANTIQVSC